MLQIPLNNDTDDSNITVVKALCDPTYMPTVSEYKKALGAYGVAFITISALVTFALYILFFEQFLFTYKHTHKVYRRHVYWLTSIYPLMSLMSLVAFVVPRAYNICNAVKVVYMTIGIGHFADLTLSMFGSERVLVWTVKDTRMSIRVPPVCCVCKCLPDLPTTGERMRLVKWFIWQLKWTQSIYFLVRMIMRSAFDDPSQHTAMFLSLNVLNLASFMSGVWALSILSDLVGDFLQKYDYKRKSLSLKLLILITKVQGVLFEIIQSGVSYCSAPYVNSAVLLQTIENSMYIIETLVFGLFSYWLYHRVEFEHPNCPDIPISGNACQPECRIVREFNQDDVQSSQEIISSQPNTINDLDVHWKAQNK